MFCLEVLSSFLVLLDLLSFRVLETDRGLFVVDGKFVSRIAECDDDEQPMSYCCMLSSSLVR